MIKQKKYLKTKPTHFIWSFSGNGISKTISSNTCGLFTTELYRSLIINKPVESSYRLRNTERQSVGIVRVLVIRFANVTSRMQSEYNGGREIFIDCCMRSSVASRASNCQKQAAPCARQRRILAPATAQRSLRLVWLVIRPDLTSIIKETPVQGHATRPAGRHLLRDRERET